MDGNDRISCAPKVSHSFITSAGKASARAWSSGLRGRLVLWGRRRQPTNELKRLLVGFPIGLKRREVRSNCEEFVLHNTAVTNNACRVTPSVACLWNPLTYNGNTAISSAAPFKLVLIMKQKQKKKTVRKVNKIKEFYEQLLDYPWQFRVLINEGGLGSILSLSVEVK